MSPRISWVAAARRNLGTITATGRKEIEKRRAASGFLIGGFSVLEPIDLPCFRLLISTFSDFFYW